MHIMRDLKDMLKGAVDKIKSTVEKEDIPLSEAYAQMDKDIEIIMKDYCKNLILITLKIKRKLWLKRELN